MGTSVLRLPSRRKPAAVLALLISLISVIAGCTGPGHSARPAGLGQPFGSDHFGHWVTDAFGLPAFDYTADEATDRAARWNDGHGTSTSFWHQLGNDRVIADAFNDGYVELWDGERQYRSSDYYDAGVRQFAGGFGYLRTGRTTWSTLYLDRPPGSSYRRTFGMGYYRKDERANGLRATQTIFAPFGTEPVLLSQIVIQNTTARAETVHYVEYWGVNPEAVMSVTSTPHVNFRGDARQALEFYHSVFGGQLMIATYGQFGVPQDAWQHPRPTDHPRRSRHHGPPRVPVPGCRAALPPDVKRLLATTILRYQSGAIMAVPIPVSDKIVGVMTQQKPLP